MNSTLLLREKARKPQHQLKEAKLLTQDGARYKETWGEWTMREKTKKKKEKKRREIIKSYSKHKFMKDANKRRVSDLGWKPKLLESKEKASKSSFCVK